MDKEVVRFESSPKGAVVMVDGDLLCQETPCSKELELGNVTVAMHKERYASHEELIEIRKNIGTISWELKPNFGWLSVVSAPS
jgi:hypothetical protein